MLLGAGETDDQHQYQFSPHLAASTLAVAV